MSEKIPNKPHPSESAPQAPLQPGTEVRFLSGLGDEAKEYFTEAGFDIDGSFEVLRVVPSEGEFEAPWAVYLASTDNPRLQEFAQIFKHVNQVLKVELPKGIVMAPNTLLQEEN